MCQAGPEKKDTVSRTRTPQDRRQQETDVGRDVAPALWPYRSRASRPPGRAPHTEVGLETLCTRRALAARVAVAPFHRDRGHC